MRISDWSSDVCSSDLWMFASAAGAVSGIAALQALAPPPVRGLAMSMIAFCHTLLGLGLFPSLIAGAGEQMAGPAATTAAQHGRAPVRTPVTNAPLVCRLLLDIISTNTQSSHLI